MKASDRIAALEAEVAELRKEVAAMRLTPRVEHVHRWAGPLEGVQYPQPFPHPPTHVPQPRFYPPWATSGGVMEGVCTGEIGYNDSGTRV